MIPNPVSGVSTGEENYKTSFPPAKMYLKHILKKIVQKIPHKTGFPLEPRRANHTYFP